MEGLLAVRFNTSARLLFCCSIGSLNLMPGYFLFFFFSRCLVRSWLAFENNLQVRFAWGGDISGQNVCRDGSEGFPVMEALNSIPGKDFFLNVGDAIYGKSSSMVLEQQIASPCFTIICDLKPSQKERYKAL